MNKKTMVVLMSGLVGIGVYAKSPISVSCTSRAKASGGVASVSVSKDGNRCVSVNGAQLCSNSKSGEETFGVSGGGISVAHGGKGTSGKDNFVKITASLPLPVSPSCSVKVKTPSFTRAGITTGSVYNGVHSRKKK